MPGMRKLTTLMNCYTLTLLAEQHAREILTWRYPAPYDFYNPPENRPPDDYIREFTNPEYQFHAVLDDDQTLAGFCSFGIDGQVPGGCYDTQALDIGLGMNPVLTGNGLGRSFFASILDYSIASYHPTNVRLTVANFNHRAFRLYQNFGFTRQSGFHDPTSKVSYTVLTKIVTMDP